MHPGYQDDWRITLCDTGQGKPLKGARLKRVAKYIRGEKIYGYIRRWSGRY